ncbi:serine/threonine protein kinase [Fimbriiglobus ruber]|nr:serine/threonine-protein kinase [Fimbriiglobus ruber]
MSDSNPLPPSSPSDAARIHELAELFDADWQPEEWARMIALINRAPPHLVPAVALEFVVIDIQRRRSRQLTLPELGSYLALFPSVAPDPSWREKLEKAYENQSVPSAMLAMVPEKIGKYPVNSLLATGAEAQVYLCYHPVWQQHVAVKWMLAKAAGWSDYRELFDRQGKLLKELEHEHIVRVYDQGEWEGRPFLVTEHIKGRTLDEYYQDVRPDFAQVVSIIVAVSAALGHAHRRGVYHQDVKPSNILIDERGQVKLIDFGLAWFRPAWSGGSDPLGRPAGTLGYLSPEQVRGEAVTARTDIFALGGVLFFLLTGTAPYPERDPGVALSRAQAVNWDQSLVDKPGIPPRLRRVCKTAMAVDPYKRYHSAEDMATAAQAAVNRPPWYRSARRIALALLLFFVLSCTAAGGRVLSNRWFPPSPEVVKETGESLEPRPGPTDSPSVQYTGSVDVLIERPVNEVFSMLRLNKAGALPLRQADRFRIEGKVNFPAYLYVVWVDPSHDVTPVYPWNPKVGWGSRPAKEHPEKWVHLPSTAGIGYTAPLAKPGMATMVMFARQTPLDVSDDVVKGWFGGLPDLPLPPGGDEAAVWFDNFVEVRDPRDTSRRRTFGEVELNDPFARWQGQLQKALGDKVSFQTAVSLARTGRK